MSAISPAVQVKPGAAARFGLSLVFGGCLALVFAGVGAMLSWLNWNSIDLAAAAATGFAVGFLAALEGLLSDCGTDTADTVPAARGSER